MKNSTFGHSHGVLFLLMLVVLLPTLCYCYETSKATYYGSPSCKGTPLCKSKTGNQVSNDESTAGACGYGEYGKNINSGRVASVSKLFRAGLACGACYKVTCLAAECSENGTTVVLTDRATNSDFDFIFSIQALEGMAKRGMEEQLKAYPQFNMTYLRVPCKFPGYNLMLKVHEDSRYPDYLAMIFYYQSGFHDITSVQIFEETNLIWRACKRSYGAVWGMTNPPRSNDLTVRFLAAPSDPTSNVTEVKWVVVPRLIPLAWSPGALYDTNFHLA